MGLLAHRSLLKKVVRLNSIGEQMLTALATLLCPIVEVFKVLLICISVKPFPLLKLLLLVSSFKGVPKLLDW